MEYLLKTSVVIAIFYLSYKLFLQRDTFFKSNRWFLLFGLVTSFGLPFLIIPVYVQYTPIDLSKYTFNAPAITEIVEKPFNILDYLPIAYGLGVVFFSIKFIIQIVSLARVIIKNKREKINHFSFIKTTDNVSPFSFFNWIVFNPNQFSDTELEQIITHEKVHANQSHSFDILLTHLCCIILWFNPFIWLYIKNLKQNLEFIADQETANRTECKKSYQYTLLKTSMPTHQMALSNHFYNSLIKKRIVMLHKSKSKKINQIKYALVIPLLAAFLMSFNTEEVYIEKNPEKTIYGSTVKNKSETQKEIDSDTLKIIFNKDLSDKDLEKIKSKLKKINIKFTYSELKRNNKWEIININTKFESDGGHCTYNSDEVPIKPFYYFRSGTTSGVGNVENEKLKNSIKEKIIIKNRDTISLNNSENESQLKPWKITIGTNAVSSYPDTDTLKWRSTKKRVGLNWVSGEDKKVSIHSESESKVKIVTSGDKEPLFIVDGKEITKDDMNSIDPNTIEKVEVIKDENATRLYGDKGKDGVILITTKMDKWETHFIVGKPFDSIHKKENSSKHTVKLSGEGI